MLLSSRSHAAGRCVHCATNTRLLSLEFIRSQTSSSRPGRGSRHLDLGRSKRFRDKDNDRTPNFRTTEGSPFAGDVGQDGFIRKFFRETKEDKQARSRSQPASNFTFRNASFPDALHARLKVMKNELKEAPIIQRLQQDQIEAKKEPQSFEKIWKAFTNNALRTQPENRLPFFADPGQDGARDEGRAKNMADLEKAFKRRGQRGLDDRIKYTFYGYITGERFTQSDINNQKALADLRYPSEWFPAARSLHRTIHLHVGPTNSGKTYNALKKLEGAHRGVYAGPLRLLAHEVYSRMAAKGLNCALVTGEERRIPEGFAENPEDAYLTSCTVEMVPMNIKLDVAVIDEIQMIGDDQRGWAWTQALLGVNAKEIHLCGEERTVPLIREIAASVGEKVQVHRYKRLSPLKVADEPLNGNLSNLRKGDCIVSFSVMGIHALRKQIERATGKKVATVYGSLPPETRASQARLFNDPNNDYDFLVASDAVGMGLNLAIKRMIFEASNKFDGITRRTLSVADIKQIAGRAGRYRTAPSATQSVTPGDEALSAAKGDTPPPAASEPETMGIVTTLEKFDFPVIKAAMENEPEPIRSAGIFPPGPILERFSSYFPPGTPFSYVLTRLHELSMTHKRFHLCGLKDQVWVADLIEPVRNLSVSDRNVICSCPASMTDTDLWRDLMPALARIIGEQSGGNLCDIKEMPLEILEAPLSASREYLRKLEQLHKGLTAYLWLSYRFAGIFTTRALAFHTKEMVEQKIEEVLEKFSFTEAARRKLAAQREKAVLREMADAKAIDKRDAQEESEGVEGATGEDERMESDEADDADVDEGFVHEPVADDEEEEAIALDRFGGEEDIEFEEPDILETEVSEQTAEPEQGKGLGFASGHSRETSSGEEILSDAVATGEEMGRQAANSDNPGEIDPTIGDVDSDLAAAEASKDDDASTLSPEQDPTYLAAAFTPGTDLPDERRPMETQEVPSKPIVDPTSEAESEKSPA